VSPSDDARRRASAILGESPPAEGAAAVARRILTGPQAADASLAVAVDGKDGAPGLDGKDGQRGPRGPEGPIGPAPEHEWDGTKLCFEQPDGSWGEAVDLKGPKGEPGRDGVGGGGIVQQSTGAPSFGWMPGGWQ
jgi:hypothetical protein